MSIEYPFFPHIFDRVIALASYESLLRLRTICRTFKNKVDKGMLHHVVVVMSAPSRHHLLFYCPSGERLPCMMKWNVGEVKGVEIFKVPKFVATSNARTSLPLPAVELLTTEQLLQSVRVVDTMAALPVVGMAFLQTLQISVVRNVVDNPSEATRGRLPPVPEVILFMAWKESRYRVGTYGKIPPSASRAVINMGTKGDLQYDWKYTASYSLPPKLQNLVLIFEPPTHSFPTYEIDSDWLCLLDWPFLGHIAASIPKAKVTFVGITEMPPHLLGFEAANVSTPHVAQVNSSSYGMPPTGPLPTFSFNPFAVIPHRKPHLPPCTVDVEIFRELIKLYKTISEDHSPRDVTQSVRFLTIEEYRNEVGPEKFELETVPCVY